MDGLKSLLLTYYGDDLTGSTDSMEALELGGVPTVLFLAPPTPEQLARHPEVRAVGLAGVSRTMTAEEMDLFLPEAFISLERLGAPLTHYKVCSTFDSSPDIGSIGKATEIGTRIFGTPVVPVMVGAPKLRRYVVFGNHFATAGDVTYRLDRHPTMMKHPITPMNEADLRLHLRRQTSLPAGLIDLHQLAGSDESVWEELARLAATGTKIAILDTLDNTHVLKVGKLLWRLGLEKPAFIVGSSGVEFALTAYWQSSGQVASPKSFPSPGAVDRIVAISGSAAPMTANQIQHAFTHNFVGVRLDGVALVDPQAADRERARAVQQALSILQSGKSALLYTAMGPDDPHILETTERMALLGIPAREVGEVLGRQQGLILREIIHATGIKRCAVAGGDTSGNVLKQLGIYELKFLISLGAATPLCRAGSHEPEFDGVEVALKGGQLGEIDFFERVLQGRQG